MRAKNSRRPKLLDKKLFFPSHFSSSFPRRHIEEATIFFKILTNIKRILREGKSKSLSLNLNMMMTVTKSA